MGYKYSKFLVVFLEFQTTHLDSYNNFGLLCPITIFTVILTFHSYLVFPNITILRGEFRGPVLPLKQKDFTYNYATVTLKNMKPSFNNVYFKN